MHCDRSDPVEDYKGDYWDHVALDPDHRLAVSLVPGARATENTEAVVADFHRRTEDRPMDLMTCDEYPAYESAILNTYGATITPPRTGKPGRPKAPSEDSKYATVNKRRERGRVVEIGCRVAFGAVAAVLAALGMSQVSRAISRAFLGRQIGTDRNCKARKVRKTHCLSKDWWLHEAVSYFALIPTLRVRAEDGSWRKRAPAMAAGLTDHVWTISEWLTSPVIQLT